MALSRRRRRRRGRPRVPTVDPFAVADVVDLFALACGAGLTVASSLRLVATHTSGPLGDAFADALAEIDDGARLSDVLADLPARVGEVVRPLSSALAMAARYGTPVVASPNGGRSRSERAGCRFNCCSRWCSVACRPSRCSPSRRSY
ncbi:MAG: type II secretion system F family protein [Actinobacteria bacterium]|nr:MAG: type II secretion system F family protein [Actinomycetota bacterium]